MLKKAIWVDSRPPGNVRELVKALESAIVSVRHEPMIFPKHLPTEIRSKMARTSVGNEEVETRKRQRSTDRKQTLPRLHALREVAVAEVEKNYLQELMSLTGGKVKDACRISGLCLGPACTSFSRSITCPYQANLFPYNPAHKSPASSDFVLPHRTLSGATGRFEPFSPCSSPPCR